MCTAGALMLGLLLTGCDGSAIPAPSSSASSSASATPTLGSSPSPSTVANTTQAVDSCSTEDRDDAVNAAAARVADSFSDVWRAGSADWDSCAALSWAVAWPAAGGTVSTPAHVLLFHHGEYLGTATAESIGFTPMVERIDDESISVRYTYMQPGDQGHAEASGRTTVQLRWDETSGSVRMSGELPPDVDELWGSVEQPASTPAPSELDQVGGDREQSVPTEPDVAPDEPEQPQPAEPAPVESAATVATPSPSPAS